MHTETTPPPTGAGHPPPSLHPDAAEVELLTFRLGGQAYAVDIMAVREIRGWTHATSLPHAPPYVRGVINLRGTVLPVLDLALRLGIGLDGPAERNVVIVVDCGGRSVGLRVDAVTDIVTVPRDDLHPPPDLTGSEAQLFVRALTLIEETMVRVLDLDGVLPTGSDDPA